MVAFFRQLCAAPFKIVLFLLNFFQPSNIPLIRLIWRIGGEPEYAVRLIAQLGNKDLVAARQEAKTLLDKTHNSQIASTMALYELYMARNAEAACQWIRYAESLGCEHPEDLLFAKLCLSDRVEAYDTEKIAKEIISRNDLPMHYTSRAYVELAEKYIEQQQWQRAEEIIDYVLSIEANQGATGLKWVTELFHGNTEKANSYLAMYKKMTPGSHAILFEAAGHYYLNDIEQAKDCLNRAMSEYAVPREQICFMKKEFAGLLDGECVGADN